MALDSSMAPSPMTRKLSKAKARARIGGLRGAAPGADGATPRLHLTPRGEPLARDGARRAAEQHHAEMIRALRGCQLFDALDAPTITALAVELVEESFGAGEPVVSQGEPGDALYVVADGVHARRERRRQEDDERADATSRRVSAFASACRADAERRAEKSRGLAAITHRSRAAVSRPVAFCRGRG